MALESFEVWRRRSAAHGQRQLADTVRGLVYRADEAVFEQLEFHDDAAFLSPTLFAYFTAPSPPVELGQVLYGLTRPDHRPAAVLLRTDAAGRASLGPAGDIETSLPSAALELRRRSGNAPYSCRHGAADIAFRLHVPVFVPGTHIQITNDIHPLFYHLYEATGAAVTDATHVRAPRHCIAHLMVALALMRTHCPLVWTEVAAFTRLIALFRADSPNSFAALSAHGAIFCNVRAGDDEVAFLEDVTHQAAHVIFNALTADPRRVIAIDPETQMHSLCDDPGEARSLYAALHGLFTYTLICRVLTKVYDAGVLPELQSHELLARLGFTLLKFQADTKRLDLRHVYTAAGRNCYEAFAAEGAWFAAKYGALVDGLVYDNQPYVFNYARFVERNGGPWPVAFEMAS